MKKETKARIPQRIDNVIDGFWDTYWATQVYIRQHSFRFWVYANTVMTPRIYFTILRNYLKKTLTKEKMLFLGLFLFIMIVPSVPSLLMERTPIMDYIIGVGGALMLFVVCFALTLTPLTLNVFSRKKLYTETVPMELWGRTWRKMFNRKSVKSQHVKKLNGQNWHFVLDHPNLIVLRDTNGDMVLTLRGDHYETLLTMNLPVIFFERYMRYAHLIQRKVKKQRLPEELISFIFCNPELENWLKLKSDMPKTNVEKEALDSMFTYYVDHMSSILTHAAENRIPLPKLLFFVNKDIPTERWQELNEYPTEWIESLI